MHDLPTPDQILEELADKVAAQIDRLASVAFDNAYREMVRYHRFLLALNASRTPDGQLLNYAEVPGYGWQAPHRDWIWQYARLFERAASRIPDDPRFIRTLARTPIRLLPNPSDPRLPPSILNAILDLWPMMIHRLEAWVTKRTTVEKSNESAAEPRLALAGSDAKAYANVLPALVGAWENLLQEAPSLYGWRDGAEEGNAERWSAFRASWPFLWQHLSNTARCLTVAVWNEDEAGAALYREALVRWPQTLGQRDRAELRWRRLLLPDVLSLDWPEASARAATLGYSYLPPPGPNELFASILRGAHDDVVLLTAALLLFWTIAEKQSSDIGGRTARSLLRRESAHDNGPGTSVRELTLSEIFLDMIRIEIAGERFGQKSYGTDLDSLVAVLDDLTERRIVPGRVFAPSTMRERDDLLLAFVVILGAMSQNESDDAAVQRIAELAQHEEVLPQGDQTLRNVLQKLGHIRSMLEKPVPQLAKGAALLESDCDPDQVASRLLAIVRAAEEAIENERLTRLKSRPVDPVKLERIRLAIESALLKKSSPEPLFHHVYIESGDHNIEANWQEFKISKIEKAQLTEPPMASPISNFGEHIVSLSERAAGSGIWGAFTHLRRTKVDLLYNANQEHFWRDAARYIEQVGPEPILLVSRSPEMRPWRRLQYANPEHRPELRIEQRSDAANRDWYIATIEGVDVFEAEFPAGVSWLFSARVLERIVYAELDEPKHYVDVTFEMSGETEGTLTVRFRQRVEWATMPIYEFHGPAPEQAA